MIDKHFKRKRIKEIIDSSKNLNIKFKLEIKDVTKPTDKITKYRHTKSHFTISGAIPRGI